MRCRWWLIGAALGCVAGAAGARDRLGMFEQWAAFRDPAVPRCYAIAAGARGGNRGLGGGAGYADIAIWPRRGIRNAVHVHLSRRAIAAGTATLSLGGQHFRLTGAGAEAWTTDARMDAAITAAMRSATMMTVTARDPGGGYFVDAYALAGAASAMDAAALGCAPQR